jgi:hypothetical protein
MSRSGNPARETAPSSGSGSLRSDEQNAASKALVLSQTLLNSSYTITLFCAAFYPQSILWAGTLVYQSATSVCVPHRHQLLGD